MTPLELLATMPEFNLISDSTKLAFIGLADCIDTTQFCQDGNYIIALYAGHLMSLTATKTSAAGGGPIQSIREQNLSLSFAVTSASQSTFNQTPCGRALLGLIKNNILGFNLI